MSRRTSLQTSRKPNLAEPDCLATSIIIVFSEKDAEWFASLGLNMMRLAINYRHLEDDMNPRVIKKEGFKWIDRVIEIVSRRCISLLVGFGIEVADIA